MAKKAVVGIPAKMVEAVEEMAKKWGVDNPESFRRIFCLGYYLAADLWDGARLLHQDDDGTKELVFPPWCRQLIAQVAKE